MAGAPCSLARPGGPRDGGSRLQEPQRWHLYWCPLCSALRHWLHSQPSSPISGSWKFPSHPLVYSSSMDSPFSWDKGKISSKSLQGLPSAYLSSLRLCLASSLCPEFQLSWPFCKSLPLPSSGPLHKLLPLYHLIFGPVHSSILKVSFQASFLQPYQSFPNPNPDQVCFLCILL